MVYSIYGMFHSQAIPKIVNDEPRLNASLRTPLAPLDNSYCARCGVKGRAFGAKQLQS